MDIYLPQIESRLIDNRKTMSNEARELSQKIISNLKLGQDASILAEKNVLGEICRALQIESTKNKFCNQWFIRLWNSQEMNHCVDVSTPVSAFELMNNELNKQ